MEKIYSIIAALQGNVTGIQQVKTNATTTTGATYNLSGQRVSNGYRGIVILNGRKYVNK